MSRASEALAILRNRGLYVAAVARREPQAKKSIDNFGTVWLCDIEGDKFTAELSFSDDQPVVVLTSSRLLPRRQKYYLATFIGSLARNRDFHVQMLEGEPSEPISLRDSHRIVERAMAILDSYGTMEAKFTEYDPDLPF
ncbi:MAG TPA: hypothetical protein VF783_13970 [Terriglobales bacterium]